MLIMDEIRAERAGRVAIARRRDSIRLAVATIVAAVCGVAVVLVAAMEVESGRVESSPVESSRVADW